MKLPICNFLSLLLPPPFQILIFSDAKFQHFSFMYLTFIGDGKVKNSEVSGSKHSLKFVNVSS
jgi:hypothetical protein